MYTTSRNVPHLIEPKALDLNIREEVKIIFQVHENCWAMSGVRNFEWLGYDVISCFQSRMPFFMLILWQWWIWIGIVSLHYHLLRSLTGYELTNHLMLLAYIILKSFSWLAFPSLANCFLQKKSNCYKPVRDLQHVVEHTDKHGICFV